MGKDKPELKVVLKFNRISEDVPKSIGGFVLPEGDWYVHGWAQRRKNGLASRGTGVNAVLTEEDLQDLFIMIKRGNDKHGIGAGGPLDQYRFLFPRE